MDTFRDYINEITYGSLQTDSRIDRIRGYIKSDIREVLKKTPEVQFGKKEIVHSLSFTEKSKYKSSEEHYLTIIWSIDFREFQGPMSNSTFSGGLHATRQKGSHIIVLNCNKAKTKKECLAALDEMDKWLSHETKHMLDDIDGIFSDKAKKNYVDSNKDYGKYVRQDQELPAFLATVIEDLKQIKFKNKNISFEDALNLSGVWKHIEANSLKDSNKLNKFKSKLAYFWHKNKMDSNAVDLDSLRGRLIRYLYAYHNKKYTLRQIRSIASRFNTEKEILDAINYIKGKII